MDADRFDRIARALAGRASRRRALLGGLVATVTALGMSRARLPGLAQDGASPVASPAPSPLASPVASPGPLDLLGGTPAAGGQVLGRGIEGGSTNISGITQEWCEDRGGHFFQSASACGDTNNTVGCGEFESTWAISCLTTYDIFYDAGCAPCLP